MENGLKRGYLLSIKTFGYVGKTVDVHIVVSSHVETVVLMSRF